MKLCRGLAPVLVLLSSFLLPSCTQVSVEGPCTVESNSSITLDVRWLLQDGAVPASSTLSSGSAVQRVVAEARRRGTGRAERIGVQAANDSVIVMLEVPESWTAASWSGEINGSSATIAAADAPQFCSGEFGSAAPGTVRKYFRMSAAAPLVEGDEGILQATFTTGTVADGVYHPVAAVAIETSDGTGCVPMVAFHRVVAGTLSFVGFDLSAHFNGDVVVNTGDVVQDKLYVATADEVTRDVAFGTAALLDEQGLPDDGLVSSDRFEAQLGAIGIPFGVVDSPECVPPIQLSFSDDDDGNNVWLQQVAGETLTFDVPPARYAEIMLFLTPGSTDPNDISTPEEIFRAIEVTFHYSDSSSASASTLLPILGLPMSGMLSPLDGAFGSLPTFNMAIGGLVPTDGSLAVEPAGYAGITAIMATPDSSKTLTGVTIEPLVVEPPVLEKGAVTPAAVDPVSIAFFGAAGMQFPAAAGGADVSVTKSVTTPQPLLVGGSLTYRITVTNEGDADSTGVTVTDTLPAQVSYVSATASDGSCSQAGGTVTCNLGVIGPGASETVDIVTTIVAPGSFSNTAEASVSGGDANPANDSGSASASAALPAGATVPTLTEWGLMLLVAGLAIAALLRIRA